LFVVSKFRKHFFKIALKKYSIRYEKAAQFYAQTEASFEEIALKFMEIKQEDALQTFLLEVSNSSESFAYNKHLKTVY